MDNNRIYGTPESVTPKDGFEACSLPLHHIDKNIVDKANQLSKVLNSSERHKGNLEDLLLKIGIDKNCLDVHTKEFVTLKMLCNQGLRDAAENLDVEKFLNLIRKEELLLQEHSNLGIENVGASVAVNGYIFTTISITVAGPNTYIKDIKAIAYKLGGDKFAQLIEI
ncbi:hypothetical protein [Priestia megaterium]|uniref:hypothetical protein n=1 Tax=Priestia megaterium TaxID=1404 RepID=UPI0028778840|nr:hypothetical protein [Priestia megaterium]MBX4163803.1 hypothetical protein [Priestia megaterium]